MGYCFLIHIITYFPLLSFAKFMDDPYDGAMTIRGIIFFTNFPENPTSILILTVYKLINFDLSGFIVHIFTVVFLYEIAKVSL